MSKQKLESFVEYKEKKAFLDRTDPSVFFVIFGILNTVPLLIFIILIMIDYNSDNPKGSVSLGYPFLVAAVIFDILAYLGVKYLISKRDPLNTLKLKASALKGADIEMKERLFKKISKNLNDDELETFEVLMPSFEGSLKELITVSKQLA